MTTMVCRGANPRDCMADELAETLHEALARLQRMMDHADTFAARLAEAERRLAAITGLCGQEGCDGEPYDTFYKVATGEFDPHVRYHKATDSATHREDERG